MDRPMKEKRIIPCLDVKDGRVVKGVKFVDFRDAGDPVELAQYYEAEGADELVFLDISASLEGRRTMTEVVKKIAAAISIPFSVGGGISSVEDMERIFDAGADKAGINTAAVLTPEVIDLGAERFGTNRIVLAMDAKWNEAWGDWEVYTHGGMKGTGIRALAWTKEVVKRGAGEILLTSIDADGTKDGFDIQLTREVSTLAGVPVIASGGAGTSEHFYEVLTEGKADAGLAATIFHFQELTIKQLKEDLRSKGVPVK